MTACWTLLEKITHILGWVSSYSLSRTVNDHSTVCSIIYSFSISNVVWTFMGFPGGSAGKEYACNAKELGSIPGFGRSPGGGHSNPLQYSFLQNPHRQRRLVGSQRVRHDWLTKHSTAWTFIQVNKFKYVNVCGTRRQLANLLSHSYIFIPKLDY